MTEKQAQKTVYLISSVIGNKKLLNIDFYAPKLH